MKLLTEELRKQLPPLYTNEEKSAEETMVIAKFFFPSGRFTWYATEFDGDDTFFGFVKSGLEPSFDELGYFSLRELENLKAGPFGLKVERDRGWKPRPLSEVMATEAIV